MNKILHTMVSMCCFHQGWIDYIY